MKIRKGIKIQTAAAVVLSAAFLFTGCGGSGDDAGLQSVPPVTVYPIEGSADPSGDMQTETAAATEEVPENEGAAAKNDMAGEVRDAGAENETAAPESQEASSGQTELYDGVLAEYRDMVQNHFYTDLRDSDDWESSFGENIGLEIRTHEQNVFYALYDIDGNGTLELIIAGTENGAGTPGSSPRNYDLYGYDGNQVVHLFPDMSFGYRTNFSLCENGVIEVSYSGSAAESGTDFYRIGADGHTPERIDSFASVGHLEGDEAVFTYSRNGDDITEEEYQTGIQGYAVPLTTTLDWVQIQ